MKLHRRVLAVLGLKQMGCDDPDEIVRHVFFHHPRVQVPARYRRFVLQVLENSGREPLVARCLQEGLPEGVCGQVLCPVRCKQCDQLVIFVPCPLCYQPTWSARVRQRVFPQRPLATPQSHTSALPGTQEKIEIMRQRVQSGQTCFHPRDERDKQQLYVPTEGGRWSWRDVELAQRVTRFYGE